MPTFFKNLPFKKYVYFADNKNLPYGNKTKFELFKITINNIKYIEKKYKPFIIVFGCNTIGITIYEEICSMFPHLMIFSIKPNYELINNEKAILIATTATINKLKIICKDKPNLNLCKMPFLATLIEENINNLNKTYHYIEMNLIKYSPNIIILGCTHFYFIKSILKNLFPNVYFIDGVEILTNKIKEFLSIFKYNYKSNKIKVKVKFTKKDKSKKEYIQIINSFLTKDKD